MRFGPEEVLERVQSRAAEITWWNRRLTKLRNVPDIQNLQSYLRDDLVEAKGPYVEFVDAPQPDSQTARNRLQTLGYSDSIIEALETELFGGKSGSLYTHQAETIEAIETTTDDVMLTVPTATGKTESFFLPVLNTCDTRTRDGMKALILYPMKTLAVDQLNRFISYLYQINRTRNESDQITIGIWDGDTPTDVGSYTREIESGSYVRGLEDPVSGEKLTIDEDGIVTGRQRDYPWLKATRERVKDGADILLTTPEALDHILVNDSESTRQVLGDADNAHPVEHLIFDEAHVWSGVSGASIQLLVKRLKHFYRDYNPQVSLVSATVSNPKDLAMSLTGSDKGDITTVDFTGRSPPTTTDPDYDRLTPCTTTELITALAASTIYDEKAIAMETHPELSGALTSLEEVGLLDSDSFSIASAQEWLTIDIREAITSAMDKTSASSPPEVVEREAGRAHLTELVLEDAGTESHWFDFVSREIPEVATLRNWATQDSIGAVGFQHLDDIHEHLSSSGGGDPDQQLQSLFAFGKLAGLITNRHHAFLRPPRAIFYCPSCSQLSSQGVCPHCGETEVAELEFCDNCHAPYRLQARDEADDTARVPMGAGVESAVDRCVDCDATLRTSSIGVPTSSLLSYMLSEICRVTPSEKVLVFSDSHSAAESVAQRIQETEYGLTAESLYVQYLLSENGTAPLNKIQQSVQRQLREAYFDPFYDDHLDQRGAAYSMIQQLQQEITGKVDLYATQHLLSDALVTSEVVYEHAESTLELVVGHELYKRFAGNRTVSFSRDGTQFYFLTLAKIRSRIHNQLPACEDDIDPVIDKFVRLLYDAGSIHEVQFHQVNTKLQDAIPDAQTRKTIHEDFIEAGDEFADLTDTSPSDIDSGLLTRQHNRDKSSLRLVPSILRCETCQRLFPAQSADILAECLECGSSLEHYERFQIQQGGSYAGDGIAQISPTAEWPLDHWASDIMSPLQAEDGPEFITVGIHKSNIPPTLRGIIEEGFRKSPPEINIVSSTPTMELGVDIGTLDSVAQVGIPPTLTNYVQRSGRTGRSQGSSSLVLTAIRGQHPVDSHFYDDLSRFFSEFEPVRVPPAEQFEPVMAAQVVTEVFGFLARTQDQNNTLERNYKITSTDLSPKEFINQISENVESLQSFISDEWSDILRERIQTIFGDAGVNAFSAVFEESGSLNLRYRVSQTYAPLQHSTNADVGSELREKDNRLDKWLNRSGYLASYRSFGQSFPIEIDGYRDDISFQSTGRLYEMFPGPENSRGAVFRLGGQKYIVDDVAAGEELTTVGLCTNEECEQQYESYDLSLAQCPHCDSALETVSVHEIGSMHARKAGPNEGRWTTRSLQSSYVTRLDSPDQTLSSTNFAGLPCQTTVGELEVTEFVCAFERRHSSSPDAKIKRAEAERTRAGTNAEEFVPIGQQYQTSGLTIEFEKAAVEDRFEGEVYWSAVTASLEQALRRAIAIAGRFDLDDFQVNSTVTADYLRVTVADGQFGGNGVTWQLGHDLAAMLEEPLQDVILCDGCTQYCERCLLLPRTPPFYLEHDLLDRTLLRRLFEFEVPE
jgi:Lhr-like helicase